jgi:hypothetical protein
MDTLNGVIQSKHIKRVKGEATISPESLIKDPKSLMGMLELADRVCEYVVIQPTVVRPVKVIGENSDGDPIEVKLPGEERDDEVVYTDELDDADKMFIFTHACGGDPDLAKFRDQFNESAASVGNVNKVAGKAVAIPRNRK